MEDKRALIVDDSKTACVVLSRVLKKYDIESDSCHNGPDALEYLKHSTPCVIFMDHNMPGMDGFEVVRKIKDSSLTASIPVLMYTGRSEDTFITEARQAGAADILSKQFKQQHVEDALKRLSLWPKQYAAARGIPAANEAVNEVAADAPAAAAGSGERRESPQDLSAIEALVDEKINEFYNTTVKPYLTQSLFNGFAEQTEHRKTREKQLLEQLKESINNKHLEGLKTMEKLQRQAEANWQREAGPKFRRISYITAAMVFVVVGFGASQWFWWSRLDSTQQALLDAQGALAESRVKIEQLQAQLDDKDQ